MSKRLPLRTAATSRRDFLKASSVLAGTALAGGLSIGRGAHAAGSDVIKIGLIGCGGRGSGAADNAMNSGPDVRLVAMADLFADRLENSHQQLKKKKPQQVQVDPEHRFVGFDAYKQLIASDVSVVLIAAASHFHPAFLKAAVEAGKHVFCEKPHGLDVPGLKVAMAAAETAQQKGLALMSGLCWRHSKAVQETINRVKDGAIGDIIAIQEYYLSSPYGLRERKPEWSEMEYQLQNWYHFNWLSGDQTAQQLIHSIDKSSWLMDDKPPVQAWGSGGRQSCVQPKYGDQFDHHCVVFDYECGAQVYGFCRDQPGVFNETSDTVLGTKGRAVMPSKCRIEDRRGKVLWKYEGPKENMYDNEHKVLFDAIRGNRPVSSAGYMFTSSMLAILAQMVCYSGQRITGEQAMQSTDVLGPSRYAFDAEAPVKPDAAGNYPAPMPGFTRYQLSPAKPPVVPVSKT